MIRPITFETIQQFWSKNLWPGRESVIEPVSCIDSCGEINLALQAYSPLFFGFFADNELVGATSLCQTSLKEYRLRGICVLNEFRGLKISKKLIKHCFELIQNGNSVWTLARIENIAFYRKFGFCEKKEVTNFEFGPHVIMSVNI